MSMFEERGRDEEMVGGGMECVALYADGVTRRVRVGVTGPSPRGRRGRTRKSSTNASRSATVTFGSRKRCWISSLYGFRLEATEERFTMRPCGASSGMKRWHICTIVSSRCKEMNRISGIAAHLHRPPKIHLHRLPRVLEVVLPVQIDARIVHQRAHAAPLALPREPLDGRRVRDVERRVLHFHARAGGVALEVQILAGAGGGEEAEGPPDAGREGGVGEDFVAEGLADAAVGAGDDDGRGRHASGC